MDVSLWARFTATERRERGAAHRVLIKPSLDDPYTALCVIDRAPKPRAAMEVIRSFTMKSGCRSCALATASSSALEINLRKITHTSTSIWAMPVRSAAPIAVRYSVSIRAWAHTKLIRQIVLTVTWTELKSSNAASLVMLPAANQRQAPSSCSLGAIHDGDERSEFGRMQASRRPNQR